jgi:hypothetical protein
MRAEMADLPVEQPPVDPVINLITAWRWLVIPPLCSPADGDRMRRLMSFGPKRTSTVPLMSAFGGMADIEI